MTATGKALWDTRKLEATLMQKLSTKLRIAAINARTLAGRRMAVTETV